MSLMAQLGRKEKTWLVNGDGYALGSWMKRSNLRDEMSGSDIELSG